MQNSRISEDHKRMIEEAVKCGLDSSEWEFVSLLKAGLSGAAVYQIRVQDVFYVIKIEVSDVVDSAKSVDIMKMASDLGICPTVYYAETTGRIVLMSYIKSLPAEKSLDNINKFAAQIRKLHQQRIPSAWKSVMDVLNENYQHFPESYQHIPIINECLKEIKTIQPELFNAEDIRLCHADLNPGNVLFNGELWLFVDWQAASPQSFYFDLACVATWFYFFDEKLSQLLLNSYLERDATEIEKAKYYLMRVFVNVYVGIGFIGLPLKIKSDFPMMRNEEIEKIPDFMMFLQSIGRGQINLSDMAEQQKFGITFFRKAKSMMNEEYKESCFKLRK